MKRLMRRFFCIFLPCCLLSGCVPHTELNEKAIIEAIGIDYDNGEYTVTIQYYNPSGSGSRTQIDTSQSNVLNAEGKGKSIYTALEKAQLDCGRKLMFGITELIIFGSGTADINADELLSFATTNFECNPLVLLAAADGSAKDVLSVKFVEGSLSTEKLKYLLQNAAESGILVLPTLVESLVFLEEAKAICIPLLTVKDNGSDASEDGKSLEISGGMLYKDNVQLGKIGVEELNGLTLLSGKAEDAIITVSFRGSLISIKLHSIDTEISPVVRDENVVFVIKLAASCELLDRPLDSNLTENAAALSEIAEKKLTDMARTSAEKIIRDQTCDLLNFRRLTRSRNYALWQRTNQDWESVLESCGFEISADININRLGLEK